MYTVHCTEMIMELSENNLVCPDRSFVAYYLNMRQRRWHMVGVYIFEPGLSVLDWGTLKVGT